MQTGYSVVYWFSNIHFYFLRERIFINLLGLIHYLNCVNTVRLLLTIYFVRTYCHTQHEPWEKCIYRIKTFSTPFAIQNTSTHIKTLKCRDVWTLYFKRFFHCSSSNCLWSWHLWFKYYSHAMIQTVLKACRDLVLDLFILYVTSDNQHKFAL